MDNKTFTINDAVFIFPMDFIKSVATQKCGESCYWTAEGQVQSLQIVTLMENKQLKLSLKSLELWFKDGFHVCLLEKIVKTPANWDGNDFSSSKIVPIETEDVTAEEKHTELPRKEETKRKRGRPRKIISTEQVTKPSKTCFQSENDNASKPYRLRGAKLSAKIMNAEKGIYNETESKAENSEVSSESLDRCLTAEGDAELRGDIEKLQAEQSLAATEKDAIAENENTEESLLPGDADSDEDFMPLTKRKRGRPRLRKKELEIKPRRRTVIDIGNVPTYERRKRNTEKREKCKVCCKMFCDYTGLYYHVKKRHEKSEGYKAYLDELKELKVVTCEICGQVFADRTLLHAHEDREHRQNNIVDCYRCKKSFRNIINLRNHVRSVHMLTGDKSKLCHLCPAKFKWTATLKQHVDEIHQGNKHAKCEICGKVFYSNSQLRRHERCHGLHKSKFVICQQCGRQFLFAHNLKRHVEAMHSERQEIYHCSYCGKGYRTKTSMVSHVQLVHFNLFSYSCKLCQSSFARSKMLVVHMLSAHKVANYQVTENPKERFKYRKNADDLFYCSYCSEGFHYKAKMVEHIHTTHAEVFPHHCDQCQQGFLEMAFLIHHKLKAHGIEHVEGGEVEAADVAPLLDQGPAVVDTIDTGNSDAERESARTENEGNDTQAKGMVENQEQTGVAEMTNAVTVEGSDQAITDSAAASLLVEVASGSKTYRYYIETEEGTGPDGSITVNPQDIANLLLMAEQTIQEEGVITGEVASVTSQVTEFDNQETEAVLVHKIDSVNGGGESLIVQQVEPVGLRSDIQLGSDDITDIGQASDSKTSDSVATAEINDVRISGQNTSEMDCAEL